MPAKKKPSGPGVSSLLRDIGARAKLVSEQRQLAFEQGDIDPSELVIDELRPFKPRIFNILEYIEQSWGLGMKLFPAQRFIVKLYYGLQLDTHDKPIEIRDFLGTEIKYRFSEREYLAYLYNEGRCNIGEQDHERRELVLAIGRRAGKTTLSSIFASYEVYRLLNLGNPQEYYGLPNGNRIQIISVATDKDQASILFNEVTGHLAKCEYFRPYIANNTQSHIMFRTPYDIERYGPTARQQNGKFVSFNGKASLRVTFKSSSPKGLRGSGNVVVIMDEMAHYMNKGEASAKSIYDAVTPSTAAFSPKDPKTGYPITKPDGSEYPVESRIITISSPLNRTGQFYDLYQKAISKGEGAQNMLAIQAPTWEVNPTLPSSYYREKYHSDPLVFMTEHGAQFSDRVKGWIERKVDLMACVDPELRPQLMGFPRHPYQMGIDIGLMGDGTAIAITTDIAGEIVLAYHEYWQAGVDWRESNPHLGSNFSTDYCKTLAQVDRLDFEEIGNWIHKLTKRFYVTEGIFDRWNGIPLEQALQKKGLTQFKSEFFQRDFASRIYQNTKMLMFDKSIKLYDYPAKTAKQSPLIEELLLLQAQQMSKNVVVVAAPQSSGFHDDMSDAYVRAVWLTAERMRNQKHVYGANYGAGSGMGIAGGAAMTARNYQMSRARNHGAFTDRMGTRNMGTRGVKMRSVRGAR